MVRIIGRGFSIDPAIVTTSNLTISCAVGVSAATTLYLLFRSSNKQRPRNFDFLVSPLEHIHEEHLYRSAGQQFQDYIDMDDENMESVLNAAADDRKLPCFGSLRAYGPSSPSDLGREKIFACEDEGRTEEDASAGNESNIFVGEGCKSDTLASSAICAMERSRHYAEILPRQKCIARPDRFRQDLYIRPSTQVAQSRGDHSQCSSVSNSCACEADEYTTARSRNSIQQYPDIGCLQAQQMLQKKKVQWTANTVEPSSNNQDYRRRPQSMSYSPPQQRPLTSHAYRRPRLQYQPATENRTQKSSRTSKYHYL